MLSPSCERCGCALDARRAGVPEVAAIAWDAGPTGGLLVRALRGLGACAGALALYAAAKLGVGFAGLAGGIVAVGMGGFLMLPFVPERLAARPRA